eukprot:Pgem_evm3s19313
MILKKDTEITGDVAMVAVECYERVDSVSFYSVRCLKLPQTSAKNTPKTLFFSKYESPVVPVLPLKAMWYQHEMYVNYQDPQVCINIMAVGANWLIPAPCKTVWEQFGNTIILKFQCPGLKSIMLMEAG